MSDQKEIELLIEIESFDFNSPGLDELLELHQEIFLPAYNDNEEEYSSGSLSGLYQELEDGTVVVARDNQKIVGIGCYSFLDEDLISYIDRSLEEGREKDEEEMLKYLEEEQKEIGLGEILLKYYDNEATLGTRMSDENDVYFSSLLVRPEYRKQGIGKQLVQKRIEEVEKMGVKAIYVDCVTGSHSEQIYLSLDFLPILTTSPRYSDGGGTTLMVKYLK